MRTVTATVRDLLTLDDTLGRLEQQQFILAPDIGFRLAQMRRAAAEATRADRSRLDAAIAEHALLGGDGRYEREPDGSIRIRPDRATAFNAIREEVLPTAREVQVPVFRQSDVNVGGPGGGLPFSFCTALLPFLAEPAAGAE